MSGQKQIASFSWNDTSPYFPTKEQSHANARLIAAAPDMLAALKHVLESNDAKLSHEMAVNAIAKAEGRS
ncbi:hypothetical protein G6L12_08165 [Agrobacterium rhizogenes]|nr:hypothetical protein [Rhizobium rhizogenes]NTF74447.1 hypothetical protein [Rhizobium rhizogenes]